MLTGLIGLGSRQPERLAVSDVSTQDLEESIEQLTTYRDRLRADVIAMGQKLKLPQKKIDSTLVEHPELQRIEGVLQQLMTEREKR